ncbi:hypothetical protein C8Q77DRAFT_502317 [Trametes polyzona]|nr:hypothetical protein C8Q77DRAFT_502317 [Trametes polyzona]
MLPADEGYTDDDPNSPVVERPTRHSYGGSSSSRLTARGGGSYVVANTVRDREELVFRLLASLPRSSLAVLQARIAPLLKLDIVGVRNVAFPLLCLAGPGHSTRICDCLARYSCIYAPCRRSAAWSACWTQQATPHALVQIDTEMNPLEVSLVQRLAEPCLMGIP